MKYEKIVRGKFKERPNRFVALVDIGGREEKVHVKNTGRCRELLRPGAAVYLEDFEGRMGSRRMRYSLVGVEKDTEQGRLMVNMDSQAPNKAVHEALISGIVKPEGLGRIKEIKAEVVYGESRLDFRAVDESGKETYIEVKGVTLEEKGVASFPDAPTERGIKHLKSLERAVSEGKGACVMFVIQMEGMKVFTPGDEKHRAFGEALRHAAKCKVEVLALECHVEPDGMEIIGKIPVEL